MVVNAFETLLDTTADRLLESPSLADRGRSTPQTAVE
jgi:hypothetical protein